jgi:hypothetical protein
MNDTQNEIITQNNQNLVETTDDIIAVAERRASKLAQLKALSLKHTNKNDWVMQGDKPYLVCSGAEKIARLFGVSWKLIKNEKIMTEDENGRFYFYDCFGEFTLGIDTIEAEGTCSQKDKFFAKSGGTMKPLSEIDETNIKKAAYSNMVVNGITRILGIRNLTIQELLDAKIDLKGINKIDYAEGGEGGGLISEGQVKRLFAIGKESGKTTEQVKEYLKTTYKIDSFKEIKKENYTLICKWVEGK